MSKKNKKNGKNAGSPANVTQVTKEVKDFTSEQVDKIENFASNEMPDGAEDLEGAELPETSEDEQKVADLKRTGNVDKYIEFLRDKLKRLKALEAKAEEIKENNLSIKNELEKSRKEFDEEQKAIKKELNTLREDLNKREKKLREEQLAVDSGEYSTVIQGLLDALRKTEVEITDSTKQLVEDMGKKHSAYINALSELSVRESELESKQQELEELKTRIDRERKRLDVAKASFEKNKTEELEEQYSDKIQDLEDEIASLRRKNTKLDSDVKILKGFKQEIASLFSSSTPEAMVSEQQELIDKCKSLETELTGRHSNAEFEEKVLAIEELRRKVNELEEQISEERLSELRLSLHNADAYILEINTYKAKLDSAEAREKSLLRTVTDLHETINRLKDEEKVKEAAFEQARRMDNEPELQNRRLRRIEPSSLSELVDYLQKYMGTTRDPEPFYYEKKTIRTFLAGLHMSPLSILQGISGTGKTSLPREIAKALVAASSGYTGKDDAGNRNEPYRICAVQSGWRDNMDLIGFYNNFEKKYKETDFFKAIYLAAQPKYKDTLFFIILDEMNLSHPEHYFADFLSMMEQSVNDRYVKIQADEELLPKLIRERQMQLPSNVRFIGTANHDETTLDFAPKTYDRSNVMVMETNDVEMAKEEMNQIKLHGTLSVSYAWINDKFNEAEELFLSRYLEFDKFIKNGKLRTMLKDRGIGVGNRFEKQAKKFICAYMALGDSSTKCLAEAVDHLITSRLFRSLRNRYDLTADNLDSFQKFYSKLFSDTFGRNEPHEGIKLLTDEIAKK